MKVDYTGAFSCRHYRQKRRQLW